MPDQQAYVGRFAPSPTGPLHLGSLFTALAGFLEARCQQGKWLLRIDDLDTPRNVSGSISDILYTLDTFGLHWDDAVDFQSRHNDEYEQALNFLAESDLIYRCVCSRKTLSRSDGRQPHVYPGLCRNRYTHTDRPHALRIKTDTRTIEFADDLQGTIIHNLATEDGDFILKRKDGIVAYQLAVVIDDTRQRISHVVRGFDLLEETPKQIYLQQILGLNLPHYMHVPVIVDQDGQKLSKQTLATAVDRHAPQQTLFRLLHLLLQNPPSELASAPVKELIDWAIAHWNPDRLKNIRAFRANQI